MVLLMIFYIFMKLIFLPKNFFPFVHGCAEANSRVKLKTSFEMHARKKGEKNCLEIYFDFFLKVADIVQ